MIRRPPRSTLFPYTTLFRSHARVRSHQLVVVREVVGPVRRDHRLDLGRIIGEMPELDRQRGAEAGHRSEEHTSELQSRLHLVCRLLLEKKKKKKNRTDKWQESA